MSIEWVFIGAILGVPIGIVIAEIQYRWWAYKQIKFQINWIKAHELAYMGMNEEKKEEENE